MYTSKIWQMGILVTVPVPSWKSSVNNTNSTIYDATTERLEGNSKERGNEYTSKSQNAKPTRKALGVALPSVPNLDLPVIRSRSEDLNFFFHHFSPWTVSS